MTRFKLIFIVLFLASGAAFGQTATPTPTFTPTNTPTITPVYGGMAGRYDSSANKQAMDRAPHIFSRGWSVIEPEETRAYQARTVYDFNGNSSVDLFNILSNSTFNSDTTGWTTSGSVSIAHDSSETDLDEDGTGGSMELTYSGAGTAVFTVGTSYENPGYFTFGAFVKVTSEVTITLEMDLSSPTNTTTKNWTLYPDAEKVWQLVTITKNLAASQQIDNVGIYYTQSGVINVDNVGLYRSPVYPGFIPENLFAGGSSSFSDITLSGDINMGDDIIWDGDTQIRYDGSADGMIELDTGTFWGDITVLNSEGGYSVTPLPAVNTKQFALDDAMYMQHGFIVLKSDSGSGEKFASWEADPAKTFTPIPTTLPDYGIWVDHDTGLQEDDGLQIDADNLFASGDLDVYAGASGGTANANAVEVVVQDNANAGISVLTPAANVGSLLFGDADDGLRGAVTYNHANDDLLLYAGGGSFFKLDGIDSRVRIGSSEPLTTLHIESAANVNAPVSSGYTNLYLDITTSGASGLGGMTINAEQQAHLRFMDDDNLAWQIRTGDSTSNDFKFYSWGAAADVVEWDYSTGDMDQNYALNVDGNLTTGAARMRDVYTEPEFTNTTESLSTTGRDVIFITDDQTVVDFDLTGGTTGQEITIFYNDTTGGSTIQMDDNGYMSGDWIPDTVGDNITMLYSGTVWVELSRSDN